MPVGEVEHSCSSQRRQDEEGICFRQAGWLKVIGGAFDCGEERKDWNERRNADERERLSVLLKREKQDDDRGKEEKEETEEEEGVAGCLWPVGAVGGLCPAWVLGGLWASATPSTPPARQPGPRCEIW